MGTPTDKHEIERILRESDEFERALAAGASEILPWLRDDTPADIRRRLVYDAVSSPTGQPDSLGERPNGDAGDAIDYALGHIARPDEMRDFLEDWRDGRFIEDWRGYIEWLQVQRDGASEARNTVVGNSRPQDD